MKVHSLQFKNINSLVGEWEIDFSDPAFTDSGFFAITGPTGAGKSTVLDAVCLALYGRTPRLGKISNTQNDMMSTNTGECMAEVVFGTEHGLFRSSWYQKRAHKKPGGALQQPERRLSDEATGAVIETKVRDLEALIEEYTGMDFDRFTRTMFLAQGGFAAFLDAPDTERSGILEEITGTQVYSELSMMVYRRCREEESRLKELQREHEDLRVMTPEEEASARTRLEELKCQFRRLEERVEATTAAIAWLDTSDRLNREYADLLDELNGAEAALREFAPVEMRLQRAEKARGAEAAYQDLRRRNEERQESRARWEEEEKELPLLEEEAVAARVQEEAAKEALLKAEAGRDADAGPAREARDLDTLITVKEAEISENLHALEAMETEVTALVELTGDLEAKRQGVLGEAAGAELYLSENAADARLSEDLSGIEHRCEEYLKEAAGFSSAMEEHAAAQRETEAQKALIGGLEEKALIKEQDYEVISLKVADRKKALEALLGGREAREVREAHADLALTEQVLAGLVKDARAIAEKRKNLTKVAALLIDKKNAAAGAAKDLEAETGRMAWLADHLGSLQEAVRQAEVALSAAELRKGLEDGVPCPVCGSRDHPYAGGNVPELTPVREEAERVSRDLEEARGGVTRLTGLSEGLESDVRHLSGQAETLGEELEQGFRAWKEAAAGTGTRLEGDDPVYASSSALKVCRTGMKAAASLKDRMEALLGEIGRAESELAGLGTRCQECRNTLKDARSGLAVLEREERHAAEQLGVLTKGMETRFGAFWKSVAKYGTFADAPPEVVAGALRGRKERYERCRETAERAGKEAERLSGEIARETARREEKEASCTGLREKVRIVRQECTGLREKRVAVYGDRDPDQEAGRLAEVVLECKRRLSAASKEREEKESVLNGLKVRLGMYEREDRDMAAAIETSDREFSEKLSETGFSSEEEFTAALITPEERRTLEERRKRLLDDVAASRTRMGSKEQEITQHKETGEVIEPKEVLTGRLAEERKLLKEADYEVHDLESRLNEDFSKREKARAIRERLIAHEERVQTWTKLDRLIGSSDGKKFRSFAQGLTLGILLNRANVHLRRLSDRYRLTRTKDQPLGILVIDSYRAGEVRPTKNLSGGETFTVSLALALGLSDLAGKNVRVDSLFLDEGFGTLDEEALDTALSALGNLRQEGKLIGVISHVQAVKDRVPVQVQVEKLPGGRSRLSGPGCRSRG